MAKPTLLPDPTCLHLQLIDASEAAITVVVTTTSEEAECPLCHGRSARIHSRYVRAVADLPWMGCAVRLQLHVRRFFCTNPECAREIFTERLPTVVAPYARRTMRLTDVFTLIGFALGGEAGKRLVAGMGLTTSPDTFLRLIRAQPETHRPTPRVLGVDDFSFLRAKTFGTILIDLEKRIPVDLLAVKRDYFCIQNNASLEQGATCLEKIFGWNDCLLVHGNVITCGRDFLEVIPHNTGSSSGNLSSMDARQPRDSGGESRPWH